MPSTDVADADKTPGPSGHSALAGSDRGSVPRVSPNETRSNDTSPVGGADTNRPDGDHSLRFLLSPRWVFFHLLVLFGIVLMINLGLWQLRRLDEVKTRNAEVAARYDEAAVPVEQLLRSSGASSPSDADLDQYQWRPVTAQGTYVGEQVRIVNRSQDGAAGWQALNPLLLEDGRLLLINRGFVPLYVEDVPAPEGEVSIDGHLRLTQEKTFGGLADPASGPLADAQRIDIERLSEQFDQPVVPMYVELDVSMPPYQPDGLPVPVHPPVLDEGNHLSYAVQWFCFATAVLAGWVLAVRYSVRRRREGA